MLVSTRQDIQNIEKYNLKTFGHRKLKQELMAQFGQINETKSLLNFFAFTIQHLLGWLIILYSPSLIITIITSIYMGFNLMGVYIVLHDAGHRTRSRYQLLNDLEGEIAGGIVGCGISWILARESHRRHHLDTGKINDPTAVWLPITIAEYQKAPKINQFFYHLKMTNPLFAFLEFFNFVRRNFIKTFIYLINNKKVKFELIRSIITGLLITIFELFLSYKLIGFYGVFFIYIFPRYIFMNMGAIFDRLNHANPEMA